MTTPFGKLARDTKFEVNLIMLEPLLQESKKLIIWQGYKAGDDAFEERLRSTTYPDQRVEWTKKRALATTKLTAGAGLEAYNSGNFNVGQIQKDRYEVEFGGVTYLIDVFHGNLEGHALAEVKGTISTEFLSPEWIGTPLDKERYSNLQLGLHGWPES